MEIPFETTEEMENRLFEITVLQRKADDDDGISQLQSQSVVHECASVKKFVWDNSAQHIWGSPDLLASVVTAAEESPKLLQ